MKTNLGYCGFSLWKALIFFVSSHDYSPLFEDLAENSCCSASLKCRFCMKILNLGFRCPPLVCKHLQWGSGPEGVPRMAYVLLCSVVVENVKELGSRDKELLHCPVHDNSLLRILLIFCWVCVNCLAAVGIHKIVELTLHELYMVYKIII